MCDSSDLAALRHTIEAVSWHVLQVVQAVLKEREYRVVN